MAIAGWLSTPSVSYAQSKLYDQHFDLSEVRLGESPFATAMYRNARLLLDYDADRLMTPFIRQAGLDKAGSKYQGWTTTHPSFPNQDAYDRLGLEEQYVEILGVKIPMNTIPITPGRNLAVILEVAAINVRQRKLGYNAAQEFTDQINRHFAEMEGSNP